MTPRPLLRTLALAAALATLPAAPAPAETIQVSNPDQLRAALGPGRTIELAPGDYSFTTTLRISGMDGLTLRGSREGRSRILVEDSYADVLRASDLADLTLEDLTLGHAPELAHCVGGVLVLSKARRVSARNLVLFGSGVEGLTLHKSQDVTVTDSEIRECTVSIMTALGSKQVRLDGLRVRDNESFEGLFHVAGSELHFEGLELTHTGEHQALLVLDQRPYYIDHSDLDDTPPGPSQVRFVGGSLTGLLELPTSGEAGVLLDGLDTSGVRQPIPESEQVERGEKPEDNVQPAPFPVPQPPTSLCPEMEQLLNLRGREILSLRRDLKMAQERIAALEAQLSDER